MRNFAILKKIIFPMQALLFALLCIVGAPRVWSLEKGEMANESAISRKNYSSLPILVAMIGSDAMEQLHGFFTAEPVMVEPFIVLNEFSIRQRIPLLGATLAEQMAAVIGNESRALWRRPAAAGEHEQRVYGVLQEIDDTLRIHIIAANTQGEQRSYVVNVEMSEPIYRALHSYVYLQ